MTEFMNASFHDWTDSGDFKLPLKYKQDYQEATKIMNYKKL